MKKLHPENTTVEIIKFMAATELPDTDAVVAEQDTNLLLGLSPVIHAPTETYRTLVREMQDQKPLTPGEVLIRDETPLRLTAIVYAIEQKPVCREQWITVALNNVLGLCVKHKIKSLAMPPLGCTHGGIEAETFMEILESVLSGHQAAFPQKIWIVIPILPVTRR